MMMFIELRSLFLPSWIIGLGRPCGSPLHRCHRPPLPINTNDELATRRVTDIEGVLAEMLAWIHSHPERIDHAL